MRTGNLTVLVTGFRGAVGGPIVRALDARGARRLLLAGRGTGESSPLAKAEACSLQLDLQDDDIVLPPGIDVVVHAAGEKRDVPAMEAVNHHGTRRLAQAAARSGVRRFVHISSVGVYGAGHRDGLIDETTPHRPANAYEMSKDRGEGAVRQVCAEASIECVVLQPSNVVAPMSGKAWPLLGFLTAVRRGRFVRFDRGDAWLNYVAVEDVAAATAEVVFGPAISGTFIVNTPERVDDVVRWTAAALRVAAPQRQWPAWAGHLASHASTLAGLALRRPGPFSPERLRELTGTTRFEDRSLRQTTGLRYPLGVKAMLGALVERYENEGKL